MSVRHLWINIILLKTTLTFTPSNILTLRLVHGDAPIHLVMVVVVVVVGGHFDDEEGGMFERRGGPPKRR